MHYHTKSSKKLQRLRDEPQTDFTLPSGGPLRSMIYKFSIQTRSDGAGKSRKGIGCSGINPVYYLEGDERRAIRKFIEANPEFVKDCMNDMNSPIQQQLQKKELELFRQEFEIMDYNDEI